MPKAKTPKVVSFHTDYLSNALYLEKFSNTIRDIAAAIRFHAPQATSIAFRGASGSLVAMPVCARLKKHPMLVRKKDGNHSSYVVEGGISPSYVIIDDLICTGTTVQEITKAVRKQCAFLTTTVGIKPECHGVFLYNSSCTDDRSPIWDDKEDEVQVFGTKGAYEAYRKAKL